MLQSDYGGLGTEISLAYPPYHVYCYPGCMNPELQPVQLSEWDPWGSLSDPPPCWIYIWTVRSEWVLLSLIWAFVNWRCNSSQVLEGWEDRMQQTKYTRMQPRRSLLRLPLCHPCKIVFGEWCFLSPSKHIAATFHWSNSIWGFLSWDKSLTVGCVLWEAVMYSASTESYLGLSLKVRFPFSLSVYSAHPSCSASHCQGTRSRKFLSSLPSELLTQRLAHCHPMDFLIKWEGEMLPEHHLHFNPWIKQHTSVSQLSSSSWL